jgi:hypothetical protein
MQDSLETAMLSSKFESLISPPWPATESKPDKIDHNSQQCDEDDLTNFERNDQTESNLDNIAILGYN